LIVLSPSACVREELLDRVNEQLARRWTIRVGAAVAVSGVIIAAGSGAGIALTSVQTTTPSSAITAPGPVTSSPATATALGGPTGVARNIPNGFPRSGTRGGTVHTAP